MKTVDKAIEIVEEFGNSKNILKFAESVSDWSARFGWVSYKARKKFISKVLEELCIRRIDTRLTLKPDLERIVNEHEPVSETRPPNVSAEQWNEIKRHGWSYTVESPYNIKVKQLIAVQTEKIHESDFPYIQVFALSNNKLYDLGLHDHILFYLPVNIDTLKHNIVRFMSWEVDAWHIKSFLRTDSLTIYSDGRIL